MNDPLIPKTLYERIPSSLSTKSGNDLDLGYYSSMRWRSHISYTLVDKDKPLVTLLRYDMAFDLSMILLLLSPFVIIKFGLLEAIRFW